MAPFRRALVVFVALAILVAGCSGSEDSDDAGTGSSTTTGSPAEPSHVDGTLIFGQLAPQTGALATIVKSLTAPVQIAVDEINAAGGFNNKAVGLAVADDASGDNPDVAAASLETLLQTNGADAILGPTASGTALELLSTIRSAQILQCSGSNSAPELSTADSGGYYFRTAPPDRLQAVAIARMVMGEARRKPAIVVRDDAYGTVFATGLRRELRKGGVTPAGPVITYDPATTNLDSVARRVADRAPDSVIAISLSDDGARLVNALHAAGVGPNQMPLYTGDGMQDTAFASKVNPTNPGLVQGIRGTAPAAAPAGIASPFTDALRRAGVLPIFSAYYYDCAILTALAAVQAESDDPTKMKAAFAKSLRGDTDCATFTECVKALQAGQTIHYRGASSRFDRWDRFEPGEGTYDLWSYGADGRVVTAPPQSQLRVP
jgi:branched-chain amino acid transport system substrate-binding protein